MKFRNKRFFGLLPGASVDPPKALVTDDGTRATIYIYDEISWYGISAEWFVTVLNGITSPFVDIRMSCPGGDVFEARPMQVAMAQHPADFTIHIDGLCASAATFFCRGANRIKMSDGGFFMIHNAWSYSAGDAKELRAQADLLDAIDGTIINDYTKMTGLKSEQIIDWMDAETWFAADKALEHGFIDEIFEATPVANKFDLSVFKNAPKNINNYEPQLDPTHGGLHEGEAKPLCIDAIQRRLRLFGASI